MCDGGGDDERKERKRFVNRLLSSRNIRLRRHFANSRLVCEMHDMLFTLAKIL